MTPANGIGAKRNRPPYYWKHAVAKRDAEGACRVCSAERRPMVGTRVEAAHLAGRAEDELAICPACSIDTEPGPGCEECKGHGVVIYVDPDGIMPLCGPATDPKTCHARQEAHELDLLPHITPEEAAFVVLKRNLARAYRELSGEGRGPSPLEAARLREDAAA